MLVIVFHGIEDLGQFIAPTNSFDELIRSAREAIERLRINGSVRFETISSEVMDLDGQSAPYIEVKCDSKDQCRKVKMALAGHVLPVLGNCSPEYD